MVIVCNECLVSQQELAGVCVCEREREVVKLSGVTVPSKAETEGKCV